MNFNERTNTLLYKNISLTLYSRKGWCFCSVWEMGGERYPQREDFFFPYLLPGARGVNACTSLQAHLRRLWSTACPSLPVKHLLDLSALIMLASLLITPWQLIKAHGVTRNKLKIHGTCYITFLCMPFFQMSMYGHFFHISLHPPSTPHTKQKQKKIYLNNSKNNTISKQLEGDLFTMKHLPRLIII